MNSPSYDPERRRSRCSGRPDRRTLARIAAAHPDAEAVVDVPAGRRWTYAELNTDVRRLAAGLLEAGIRPGERVALWAPNCGEWILLQHATAVMGAILVNINPNYRTHELSYALRQSGAAMLVTLPEFRTSNYRAMVDEVRGECPDLRSVVYLGEDGWTRLTEGRADPGTRRDRGGSLHFDDPINIQYTSGTTGFPKGATLTHHNLVNNGLFLGEVMDYTPADRICVPVPFYHCFGMVIGNLAALTHASTVIIPAPVSTRRRRSRPAPRRRPRRSTASRPCSSRCSASEAARS